MMIELFSDERVMKRMKDVLYPRELVEKLDEITRSMAVLTTSVKARDDRIKTLESKVAALEHEGDKTEQYSICASPELRELLRRTKTRRKQYWTLSTKKCALTPRYIQNKSRGATDLEGRPTGTGKRDRERLLSDLEANIPVM